MSDLKQFSTEELKSALVILEGKSGEGPYHDKYDLSDEIERREKLGKINVKAFERLADKMEGKGAYARRGPIKMREFHIGEWSVENDPKRQERDYDKATACYSNKGCGTVACILGWAANDKWFKDKGLRIEKGKVVFGRGANKVSDFTAAQKFFGIDYSLAESIFSNEGFRYKSENPFTRIDVDQITPKMAAKHLRNFIKALKTESIDLGDGAFLTFFPYPKSKVKDTTEASASE